MANTEPVFSSFSSLPLHSKLRSALAELPFSEMTPVQQKCIPALLLGKEVIGQAKTGSGKTLAFLVPALDSLLRLPNIDEVRTTRIIVIIPTKELAIQINDICEHLVKFTPLKLTVVTGGIKVKRERDILKAGVDIVIATPGRLLDHIQHCAGWNFKELRWLIIDEADRLLADGFQKDMDTIMQALPTEGRQTTLFSATNNAALQELSRITFSRPPIYIAVDSFSTHASSSQFTENGLVENGEDDANTNISAKKGRKRTRESGRTTTANSKIWKGQEDEDDDLEDDDDDEFAQQHKTLTKKQKKSLKKEQKSSKTESENTEIISNSITDGVDQTSSDNSKEISSAKASKTPTNAMLQQFFVECEWEHRLMLVYSFLKHLRHQKEGTGKVIIFFSTCASVRFHQEMLHKLGIGKDTQHGLLQLSGKMKVRQRLATFRAFCECSSGILLATDVAARGLDIPKVSWIVQFDPPSDVNEYIHRVGRTARAGAAGAALLFLNPLEFPFLKYLKRFSIYLEEYDTPFKVPNLQIKFETILQEDDSLNRTAVRAFRAFVMSYTGHKLQDVFDAKHLDLETIAISFALDHIPTVTITKKEKAPYVKGAIKSMMRKKMKEEKWQQSGKGHRQWDSAGNYVGRAPSDHMKKIGTTSVK